MQLFGLCRHAVRIGGGFSWEWSNGNELWKLVVVTNLFARCGSFTSVWSRPQLWDNNLSIARGACSTSRLVKMFKKVTGAAHVHVFHHQLRATKDNADGNGFNTSVQPYAMAIHSDSSQHAAEEAFLRFAGNAVDVKFSKGRFVYINAWRNITTDPIREQPTWQCATRPL